MKYNKNQIEKILNNKYVLRCSENSITFTKECKIKSVKLWNNWFWTKEIFRKFNFPEYISDSKIPENSICRWNRQFKKHWEKAFWIMSKRWKKLGFKAKKEINLNILTDKEKIEYLKTEVVYLKELYKEKHWFYP